MDSEVANENGFEDKQQFWTELAITLSQKCDTHVLIDDALRSYLALLTAARGRHIDLDADLDRCSYELHSSPLFNDHSAYIRRQFIHCLIQEDESDTLLVATSFLLADAQVDEHTYKLLNEEGAFPRLVDLVSAPKDDGEEGLHRLLMNLLYEMARVQKIALDDLACVQDDFIRRLFDIIEQVSDDVTDPYHYPVIRLLLVINEQFMVAAHDPNYGKAGLPLTNKVIKVLSAQGTKYKTFGENIILLLNREDETSLQLLTLKLMYLLFTTPPTYEYFYTNDLRVLVDILVRNLLDLPEEAAALRHTYLRVLYPLLEHTQLQHPPHYKRDEIRRLLNVLCGGTTSDTDGQPEAPTFWGHFAEVDETTKRLVKRCQGVSWLVDEPLLPEQAESPTEKTGSAPSSPLSPSKSHPPALPLPRKLKKRNSSKGSTLTIGQYLTPQLEGARQSSLSMIEMAAQKEKPGVITPSRNPSLKHGLRAAIMHKKERPPPPKARRSGWARTRTTEQSSTGVEVAMVSVEDDSLSRSQATRAGKPQAQTSRDNKDRDEHVPSQIQAKPVVTVDGSTDYQHYHRHHHPHPRKPPPAPKGRHWRSKGAKEGDEAKASGVPEREPGKFDVKLPSIVTTIPNKAGQSPFSPVQEKTLSPGHDETTELPNEPHSSVSEALDQAQKQAINGIEETLEKAHLSSPPSAMHESNQGPSNDLREETEDMTGHDATTCDEPNRQARVVAQSQQQQQPQQERRVLAPPGQAPIRGVPGPRWELERSPFLSDEDENENEDGNDDDDDSSSEDR